MPWLETSSVEQRERFIADERLGLYTRTELCARYGISRKTGYKWLDRFDQDGRRGLRDRSPAPRCPHTASRRTSRTCCARRGAGIRIGGPASCSTGLRRGIPRSPTTRGPR